MRTAIQLEFDRLWAVANSTRAFAICPEWSGLVYVNGPMAPLVAQADPQRCEIQLSPALIQAVFFRATEWLSIYWQGILQVAQLPAYVEWVDPRDVIGNSTVGRRTYLDVYPEFGKITRETRVDRDLAAFWVRSVQERFLGDLRFIIAHEIGHAALWAFGPNTLANELAADCYGIWSMRTVFGTTDTRVFESFLQASVVEDRRDLWGIVATEDDLRRRKARLQFLASAPLVSEHVEFCAS
jgi:hypothetical protein